MFPRGIKTKYAKEKEKAEKAKALEEQNRKLTAEIKQLSQEYDLKTPENL